MCTCMISMRFSHRCHLNLVADRFQNLIVSNCLLKPLWAHFFDTVKRSLNFKTPNPNTFGG